VTRSHDLQERSFDRENGTEFRGCSYTSHAQVFPRASRSAQFLETPIFRCDTLILPRTASNELP
jgi:hypothetical protein